MIRYYIHLVNKPYITLSTAEKWYIELFPYLLVGAILFLIVVSCFVWEIVADIIKKKRGGKK